MNTAEIEWFSIKDKRPDVVGLEYLVAYCRDGLKYVDMARFDEEWVDEYVDDNTITRRRSRGGYFWQEEDGECYRVFWAEKPKFPNIGGS